MTDDEARQNAARSFELAITELRRRYLAERLPGETAKQWRERIAPGPPSGPRSAGHTSAAVSRAPYPAQVGSPVACAVAAAIWSPLPGSGGNHSQVAG
jgi:hypothetical protein